MESTPASLAEPPKTDRKWRKYAVRGVIAIAVLALWIALDWEHPLGSDISPDGRFRADYSYSASDVIMLFIHADVSPDLHLKLIDRRTGDVVSRHNYSGDTGSLEEARARFQKKIPWALPDD